jgi:hypothetical protein
MTMRWLNLGMLLLGTLMFACGEDAPPIDPPPAEVAQTTTQSATESTPAAKDAGADAQSEASASKAEPQPAPPAAEDKKQDDADDDDDHDRPGLAACLFQCGADLACGRGCFNE